MDHATVLATATHVSTTARVEGAAIIAVFLVFLAVVLAWNHRKVRAQRARTEGYRRQSEANWRAFRRGPGGPVKCRCGARYPVGSTTCVNCWILLPCWPRCEWKQRGMSIVCSACERQGVSA